MGFDISGITNLSDKSIFDIYDLAVEHFPEDSIFVEIGCYYGGSTIYLAKQIIRAKKRIYVYAIDTWDVLIDAEYEDSRMSQFPHFWNNVIKYNCQQIIKPIQFDSSTALKMFDKGTVDFVYIDGDHSYNGFMKDFEESLRIIKDDGWIAGHDYNQEVEKALNDYSKIMPTKIEVFADGARSFLIR